MFGLGAIFVEVLKDVVYRKAPFALREAVEMINEIRGAALLKGSHRQVSSDIEELARVLAVFLVMVYDLRDVVKEIEVNPLLVLPGGQGVRAIDALIVQ